MRHDMHLAMSSSPRRQRTLVANQRTWPVIAAMFNLLTAAQQLTAPARQSVPATPNSLPPRAPPSA